MRGGIKNAFPGRKKRLEFFWIQVTFLGAKQKNTVRYLNMVFDRDRNIGKSVSFFQREAEFAVKVQEKQKGLSHG